MIYVKNWKFFHRLLLDKVDLTIMFEDLLKGPVNKITIFT